MTLIREDPIKDHELIAVLEPALGKQFNQECHITRFSRRLYEYHSSFAIEELEVQLDNRRQLNLIFKNLSGSALLDQAKRLRSAQLYDPQREIEIYTHILEPLRLGTAICYAAEIDPQHGRFWLFLEKVPGQELYQIGEFDIWENVARWLATFHSSLRTKNLNYEGLKLLNWDGAYYELWKERLLSSLSRRALTDKDAAKALDSILDVYELLIRRLVKQPHSLIHGEFYASNILIDLSVPEIRICPIDWETAGRGPSLMDLAALVAGKWNTEQREAMASAYWTSLGEHLRSGFASQSGFRSALICCRLFLAIQMLGRPLEWEPPREHRQDWLREANELLVLCRDYKFG
jgi:aminoglycoside/choline kinase family phosphotransferase